jgi:hypothetical protein
MYSTFRYFEYIYIFIIILLFYYYYYYFPYNINKAFQALTNALQALEQIL